MTSDNILRYRGLHRMLGMHPSKTEDLDLNYGVSFDEDSQLIRHHHKVASLKNLLRLVFKLERFTGVNPCFLVTGTLP